MGYAYVKCPPLSLTYLESLESTSIALNPSAFPSISKINSQLQFIPTLPLQLITPTSPSTAPLSTDSPHEAMFTEQICKVKILSI